MTHDWLTEFCSDPAFDRVRTSCELPLLASSRVVVAGAGGAAQAVIDLVRMGVGEVVLIDFDRVDPQNIATQAYQRSDVGLFKVEALGRAITRINPRVAVLALAQPLESYNGACFDRLLRMPMAELTRGGSPRWAAPAATLLWGMTDSVPAQARVNRLALACAVPSLCVQIYREGLAFELTFTHPEATIACHRCILGKRFAASETGLGEAATSAGSPVTTTMAANALTTQVSLALLHGLHGGTRWSRLLRRISGRNFVQVRADAEAGERLGLGVFDRTFEGADASRLVTGEPVWIAPALDPGCPDCAARRRHAVSLAGTHARAYR